MGVNDTQQRVEALEAELARVRDERDRLLEERRQSEATLERLEAELSAHSALIERERGLTAQLIQHLPGAFVFLDRDLYYRQVNDLAARMFFHRPREAILGRRIAELMPEHAGPVIARHSRVLAGETVTQHGMRLAIETPEGPCETFWDFTSAPLKEPDGTVLGVMSLGFEVTERIMLERNLKESEEQFRATFEGAGIGMAMATMDGRLFHANAALGQMLGCDPHDLIGGSFASFTHPEDLPLEQRHVESLLDGTRDGYKMDKRYVRRDGSCFWGHLVVTVVREADGKPKFVIGMVEDIDERVRLQRERIEALQQADRLKTQFLSVVSHELRTPINAIMGFGSVLEDELAGPLNLDQQRYLGKILNASDALLSLVNDVLDMSRLQAGQLDLALGPVEVAAAADAALAQAAIFAEGRQLRLHDEVPAGLPPVLADAQRVGQILGHLLTNAVKYTPDGGEVWVRARREGGHVRLEVSDTGVGIPPEQVSRLFAPFTQLDMSATRKVGGLGIGLSFTRALVEAHGGTIGVESTPGRGSTFWFTLPVATP